MVQRREDVHGGVPSNQRVPLIVVLAGAAAASIAAIAIALHRPTNHSTAPVGDLEREAVARERTDYPRSSEPRQAFANPDLQARTGVDPGAPPMPSGPAALRMTPEEATRLHVKGEFEGLRRSGPASAALTADALRTVEDLKKVPGLVDAEFSEFKCFGDGCAVSISSRGGRPTSPALVHAEAFMSWSGPKFLSGPLPLASGEVQTVLVLHRNKRGQE